VEGGREALLGTMSITGGPGRGPVIDVALLPPSSSFTALAMNNPPLPPPPLLHNTRSRECMRPICKQPACVCLSLSVSVTDRVTYRRQHIENTYAPNQPR